MHYELDETWMPFSSLMLKHIYNVLLICSEYDRFMLEEDGRVEEELYREYTSLGLTNPPKITHVTNEEAAMEQLKSFKYDLVISMLDLGTGRVESFAKQVKVFDSSLRFVVLSPSPDHRKAKVQMIVETGLEEIQAEPSEGTHFFQNVTSVGYFYASNNPLQGDGRLDYKAIMELPLVEETEHFVHVRSKKSLVIKADGKAGRSVVLC